MTSLIITLILLALIGIGGFTINCLAKVYRLVIQPLLRILILLRFPVLIFVLCSAIFFVGQTQDILRTYVLDDDVWKISISTASTFFLSISIWYSSRLLTLKFAKDLDLGKSIDFNQEFTDGKELIKQLVRAWTLAFKSEHSSISSSTVSAEAESEVEDASPNNDDDDPIQLVVPVYLTIIPRLSGLLLVLLGIAVQRAVKVGDSSSSALALWMAAIGIALLIYGAIIVRRRSLLKLICRLTSGPDENGKEQLGSDGLLSDGVENYLANFSYAGFTAVTLPIVIATSSRFSWGVVAILCLGIVINVLLGIWTALDQNDEETQRSPQAYQELVRNSIMIPAIANLILFVGLVVIAPPATAIPYTFGNVSVLVLGFVNLTLIGSSIYFWGLSRRLPAVATLLILAFFFSIIDINDNHQLRQLPVLSPSDTTAAVEIGQPLPSTEDAFKEWFVHRSDLDEYRTAGKNYPVYLVAAEGGGIYAAYHAAVALGGIEDLAPQFAAHTFAISAVSGGSVGSAGYASIVKACEGGCEGQHRVLGKKLYGQDLLSPLLAMFVFPNPLQRFLPFPINDWDRARGLEAALERAWTLGPALPLNSLAQGFNGFWTPEAQYPALLLNTTVVEAGERAIFAPFQIKTLANLRPRPVLKPIDSQVRLSTAACLSARFPIVTPAGWIERHFEGDRYKTRMVDGGYFDNSGVATVMGVYRSLDEALLSELAAENGLPGIDVTILSFQTVVPDFDPLEKQWMGLNEILSPLRALLNVRSTLGNNIIVTAQHQVDGDRSNPFTTRFREILISTENTTIPLGWFLSEVSQGQIDEQVSFDQACDPGTYDPMNDSVIYRNSCTAQSIVNDLL